MTSRERIATALVHREPARFSALLSEYRRLCAMESPFLRESSWEEALIGEADLFMSPLAIFQKMSEYFRRMIISFFLEMKLINEKLARKLSTP